MMGWYHNGTGWAAWLVMSLAMVAFWGLVIRALVVILPRGSGADTMPSGRRRDPLEILDERFARGEIDAEEYHARQDVLRTAVH